MDIARCPEALQKNIRFQKCFFKSAVQKVTKTSTIKTKYSVVIEQFRERERDFVCVCDVFHNIRLNVLKNWQDLEADTFVIVT